MPVENMPTSPEQSNAGFNCEAVQSFSHAEAEEYWEIASSGFNSLNSRSLLKQSMTKDEFLADLANPSVLKFKASQGGEPIALFVMHTDLKNIKWVNNERVEEFARNDVTGEGNVFYITSLVVKPDQQGIGAGAELLRYMCDWYKNSSSDDDHTTVILFDHGMQNSGLPEFIGGVLEGKEQEGGIAFDLKRLGSHQWFLETLEMNSESVDSELNEMESIDEGSIDRYYQSYLSQTPREDYFVRPWTRQEFVGIMRDPDVQKLADGDSIALIRSNTEDKEVSEEFMRLNYPDFNVKRVLSVIAEADQVEDFLGKLTNHLGRSDKELLLIHDSDVLRNYQTETGSEINIDRSVGEEQSMWALYVKKNTPISAV
jgi:Acetyltransferase (GNAT) family